jgi:hypothetical protein
MTLVAWILKIFLQSRKRIAGADLQGARSRIQQVWEKFHVSPGEHWKHQDISLARRKPLPRGSVHENDLKVIRHGAPYPWSQRIILYLTIEQSTALCSAVSFAASASTPSLAAGFPRPAMPDPPQP